jgi:hypothetical protein
LFVAGSEVGVAAVGRGLGLGGRADALKAGVLGCPADLAQVVTGPGRSQAVSMA